MVEVGTERTREGCVKVEGGGGREEYFLMEEDRLLEITYRQTMARALPADHL